MREGVKTMREPTVCVAAPELKFTALDLTEAGMRAAYSKATRACSIARTWRGT